MAQKELIDPRIADLEAWDKLVKYPEFAKVVEYVGWRKTVIDSEITVLGQSANQDNAIKILTLLARKSELDALINRVEFKKNEKRKMEERING